MKRKPKESTARVLALAVAFFAGLGLLGISNDVFARLDPATRAALALFTAAFVALTYGLDANVREAVKAAVRRAIPERPLRKAAAKSPAANRAVS